MESFNSLVAKQVSGTLREGLFQKEYLTEFLTGEGTFHIHMEVERRAPSEAFVMEQYKIFSVFDLESLRSLALSLWNNWIFCTQ